MCTHEALQTYHRLTFLMPWRLTWQSKSRENGFFARPLCNVRRPQKHKEFTSIVWKFDMSVKFVKLFLISGSNFRMQCWAVSTSQRRVSWFTWPPPGTGRVCVGCVWNFDVGGRSWCRGSHSGPLGTWYWPMGSRRISHRFPVGSFSVRGWGRVEHGYSILNMDNMSSLLWIHGLQCKKDWAQYSSISDLSYYLYHSYICIFIWWYFDSFRINPNIQPFGGDFQETCAAQRLELQTSRRLNTCRPGFCRNYNRWQAARRFND